MSTVLVTGATSGIGRDTAKALAREGHVVFATGRSSEALASLAAECAGTALRTLRLDVTDPASIAAAVAEVDGVTGGRGLDALVNCAGYGQTGAVLELDDARLRGQFDTNVFGLVAVTRAFVGPMIARGEGRIVNVSSIGGWITFPLLGAYNASKHAVESLSDALRRELAPLGVRVVLVEPGPIRTRWNATAIASGEVAGSPWDAVRARTARVMTQAERLGADPSVVTAAIRRAVTAPRPKARYVAPRRDGLVVAALNALPTRLLDWLMVRIYGLYRVRPARLAPSTPFAAAPSPAASGCE